MPHFVYILECADGTFYVGETSNLPSRLEKHHDGTASAFTATRRPVSMVYSEEHVSREAALARERQLKRWTRAKKWTLIRGDLAGLKALAVCRGSLGASGHRQGGT